MLALPVGAEGFAFADVDRPVIPGDGAGAFAQDFLRAETPAHFRKIGSQAENVGCIVVATLLDGEQRFGDVIMHRAAHDARLGGRAVDAARRFDQRLPLAIAQKDRLKILDPLGGVLLRRRGGRDTHALPTVRVEVEGLGVVRIV